MYYNKNSVSNISFRKSLPYNNDNNSLPTHLTVMMSEYQ